MYAEYLEQKSFHVSMSSSGCILRNVYTVNSLSQCRRSWECSRIPSKDFVE